MHAKLIVTGGKANKKEVLLSVPVVVGRSRGAGLTIAHPMVSRQHCEIFESDGLLRIRDLGSTNGTYVGGKKIQEAVLRAHEQFTIGPLTFEVSYDHGGDARDAEGKPEAGGTPASLSPATVGVAAAEEEYTPLSSQPAENGAFDFLAELPPLAESTPLAAAPPVADAELLAPLPGLSPVESPVQDFEFLEPGEDALEPGEDREPLAGPAVEQGVSEPQAGFARVAQSQPRETAAFPPAQSVPAPVEPDFAAAGEDQVEAPVPAWEDLPLTDEAAWDLPGDVLPIDDELAAPQQDAVSSVVPETESTEPPPVASLPEVAPPEGDLPDFGAWPDAPANGSAANAGPQSESFHGNDMPAELSTMGQGPSENGFDAFPGDQTLWETDADEVAGGPSLSIASDPQSSPWEELPSDAPTTAYRPATPPPQAKPKKGWWPFKKDKTALKTSGELLQGSASPRLGALGDEASDAPQGPLPNEAAVPELPAAAVPQGPQAPGPREGSPSELDDFLSGLQ